MRRNFLQGGFLLLLSLSAFGAENTIGFREIEIGAQGDRPLHVAVWYPTSTPEAPQLIGETSAFLGINAVRNAQPNADQRPLVVLSHGYGGNWRNLNWLAAELVHNGYRVAAPDHPGTTTQDKDPKQAAQLWQRPRDISRVIDALIENSSFAGPVDRSRISAIGHSLGGWTVTALAGGQFNDAQLLQDCTKHKTIIACKPALMKELGLSNNTNLTYLERPLRDPRISKVIALDPGILRGFTPQSLAKVQIPFLVIAAGTDIASLPAELESGYLINHLPVTTRHYVLIPDATHFSFMQIFTPGFCKLVKQQTPEDAVICLDGGKRNRAALHQQIAKQVLAFLSLANPAH